ncbi:hypothetical protein QR77_34795 [Streptomyces sp. 150FB]|nr:hypothetical protein QR77_34795 [Streptomyces sp. 150FB]
MLCRIVRGLQKSSRYGFFVIVLVVPAVAAGRFRAQVRGFVVTRGHRTKSRTSVDVARSHSTWTI